MRNYIVLFLGCLLFHVAGTWSLPLIDRDEPRFAEAAREMRERGDYIVPYFNNQFRFDKPPLTYWSQVASYRFFGENDFAARFPTAVAAALVALLLFSWGKRVRDERAGWWAAIIFTLSLQTFIHGKAAVADIWLVLFVTLAHWAGWELLKANTEHRTSLRAVGSTKPEANIERRISNSFVVGHLLRFVGVGVSGQGADWVDAVVNGCDCPRICSPGRLCGAFQIRPRRFIDVGAGLSLGNSSAPSNTWGIFPSRDWETRSRAFDRDHGRTWRVIHLDVSGASSFLFHHSFREFFSVVDQTAGALEKPAHRS